jgi:hypothetical protein
MGLQAVLIKLSRGLFAYQMFMVVRPLPTIEKLMDDAHRHSAAKTATAEPLAAARV